MKQNKVKALRAKPDRIVHVLSAVAVVLTFAGLGIVSLRDNVTHAAAPDTMYLSPASGSYKTGATIAVAVRENSNSDQVNAVQADLTYDAARLQFVSINATGSAFGIDASSTGGSGHVSIARGNTSAVTGDKLIATINFKVTATGSASVGVASSSVVVSSTTNSNVVSSRLGATYALSAPTVTPPPTKTPPSSGSTSHTAPSTTTRPATQSTGIAVTPEGSTSPATVPGDSKVQVSSPATLQPADSSKPVEKVEYYLNGKLIASITQPPFAYHVDTKKLLNGTYKLSVKTYNQDNTIDTANSSLVVKNPASLSQAMLQLKHYAWVIIIVLVIVADLIITRYIRRRRGSAPLLTRLMERFRNRGSVMRASSAVPNPAVQSPPSGTEATLNHITVETPGAGQVIRPIDNDSNPNQPPRP